MPDEETPNLLVLGGSNSGASLTNAAIYWRGLFIQRYAGIEFAVTHLLAMASKNSTYARFGPLPYRMPSKIKRLNNLLEIDGPLKPYEVELRRHVNYFAGLEEMRTHIVHGIMVAHDEGAGPICKFRMYQHNEGEPVAALWDLPLSRLREVAEAIQPYSTDFTGLVNRVGIAHLIGK